MGRAGNSGSNNSLPVETIFAAVSGDEEALCSVLHYYSRHINRLATVTVRNSDGSKRQYVDEELRQRLEMKLIISILKFRMESNDK